MLRRFNSGLVQYRYNAIAAKKKRLKIEGRITNAMKDRGDNENSSKSVLFNIMRLYGHIHHIYHKYKNTHCEFGIDISFLTVACGATPSRPRRIQLNRLKEIVIDSLDGIDGIGGHRHSEFDHQFSQP